MSDDDQAKEFKSKSQVKRDLKKIQKMAEELVDIPVSKLKLLNLSRKIIQSVEETKSTSKFGAKKRSLKHIGALLRDIDTESLERSLDSLSRGTLRSLQQSLNKMDQLMDKLLSHDKKALNELITNHPSVDRQHLNQLIRNAQKENKTGLKTTHKNRLFKFIKQLDE